MKYLFRLVSAVVLAAVVTSPAVAFVFAHLSDPHVNVTGDGRFAESGLANLQRAVEAVRMIEPAFVLVTGDVTERGDDASLEAYQAEIAKLNRPVYTVQGNHDRPRHPEAFNRVVGPTHPVFDYEACRFVGLNLDSPGDALALLAEQLADAKAKGLGAVFTFAHYPLIAPDGAAFNIAAGFASLRGEPAVSYLNLARNGDILAHFCGHLHTRYEIADPYTGVLSLAVPGCVDHKSAFRICAFKDGILSWSVGDALTWPLVVVEGVTPHVTWGTAYATASCSVRLLVFGPAPVQEAELQFGNDTTVPLLKGAEEGTFEAVLDCSELKSNYYDLKTHVVDAAGNESDQKWRVLVKGIR